jgi:hypothetical protein
MPNLNTQYQNSIRGLSAKPLSFIGEHSINHYDSSHHSALNNDYQNSVFGLYKHPLGYISAHPLIDNDFTRRLVLKVKAYLGTEGDETKKKLAKKSPNIRH